jgi:DNA polymerase III epsilon subunit-like protein
MSDKLPELYIATDVEADGPIPGPYSMLSFGMAVVGYPEHRFYTEVCPISEEYVEAALEVSGLDRERLLREAPGPKEAMQAAFEWINGLRKIGRPVFLAAPAVWDGMFIHWYFMRYLEKSPFGQTGSGIDLRSFWMGKNPELEWVETHKGKIKWELDIRGVPHTHHAGEDAAELATVFEAVLESTGRSVGASSD